MTNMLAEQAVDVTAALSAFWRDGYARVGKVLSDSGISALGARVDDLMHARVCHEGLFFQADAASGRYEDLTFGAGWQGPSSDYRKIEKLELDPIFRAWIENPLFERIARAHVADEIALYRAVLFTKSARGGTALPWHQDGGVFWGIDRAPTLQIWTALDDAPEHGGCLEIVPGSHRAGLATPQGGVIPEAAWHAQTTAPILLPARAGEVILVHNHAWHRSSPSTSGHRRAALSVCYMSAATRCLRKKRAPRQFVRLFGSTIASE